MTPLNDNAQVSVDIFHHCCEAWKEFRSRHCNSSAEFCGEDRVFGDRK